MNHWTLAIALVPMFLAETSQEMAPPPTTELATFSDFPATEFLDGPPASVDLSTHPRGQTFRTVLRQGTKTEPNFAGTYSLVIWGCGTECQTFAIVDRRSGKIVEWRHSVLGVDFRVDSRLLVVNPVDPQNIPFAQKLGVKTEYYLMDKGSLSRLGPR